MENIEIWTLDGVQAEPLESIAEMESEKEFEDILTSNPNMLLNGLTLVGRQLWTDSGPLDLLGVDSYGRLCMFELKRGVVARDAVAQAIDYASDLDGMELSDLADHISQNLVTGGMDAVKDFRAWYDQKFEMRLDELKPLRLFLVGLGADDTTERMVKFLAGNGLDISLLTFHGFAHAGKTLLAKQVEVEGGIASERPRTARYTGRAQRETELDQRIEEYGVRELFDSVVAMFREEWGDWARETRNPTSLTFALPTYQNASGWGAYARVDVDEDVWITFRHRAFTLCVDGFKQAMERIEYQTYPQNQDPWGRTDGEVSFPLTAADWNLHKETLTALAQAVYAVAQAGYAALEAKYGDEAD